jgi:hypothetical protein
MITEFKIFEDLENETTFILNDLVEYYKASQPKIKKFIKELLIPGTSVKFNISYAYNNSEFKFMNIRKDYTGIIYEILEYTVGYTGTLQHKTEQHIILSLILKNDINIEYRIKSNSPFTIYGNITEKQKSIINDLNLIRVTKNFNI